jgi:serine/threonine protein kinase
MPLGLFGGGGNSGPKPQPLTSEKENKKEKANTSATAAPVIKDCKGSTVKLGKKTFTVESKLAEGGFAIVYLVCDKHNRYYALKRQLIRDDPRQVDACRTEFQIVKNLNGHKNIVAYVDHQLTMNKAGVYDYMLLTVYYKTNVLQLLNSRLLANRWLTPAEILDIFCDVCEAVARLHHSKTPVIHRDLKVENVLIDQRTGSEKPVYVLCDFGSATTKVLSKETHSQVYMEEEIKRYTTLSYRAPEMIDLFCDVAIDTKSDIWALGVLLYKLCYFALPFGESALAIQNGTFSFPDDPAVPDELKAIINLLLTTSAKHRPNIYQASHLAFAAASRKCPVYNIEKSPRIELSEAVQILCLREKLGTNYTRRFEKAFNEFEEQNKKKEVANAVAGHQRAVGDTIDGSTRRPSEPHTHSTVPSTSSGNYVQSSSSSSVSTSGAPSEGVIVNTTVDVHQRNVTPGVSGANAMEITTSVNPRLRPKPMGGMFPRAIAGVGTSVSSPRSTATESSPTPMGNNASKTAPPLPTKPTALTSKFPLFTLC